MTHTQKQYPHSTIFFQNYHHHHEILHDHSCFICFYYTALVSVTSTAVNDGVCGSINQTQTPRSLDFTSYAAKQTPKDAEKQQKGKEPSAILDGIRADDKLVDTEDLSFTSHQGDFDISPSLTAPGGLVQSGFWLVLQPITQFFNF